MTAPDVNEDVRARFERDYMLRYPNAQGWMFDRDAIGNYMHEPTHLQWLGYRAAHADLSGEVRELAADWRERVRAIGRDCGSYKQCADELEAALAKFTHQEKP